MKKDSSSQLQDAQDERLCPRRNLASPPHLEVLKTMLHLERASGYQTKTKYLLQPPVRVSSNAGHLILEENEQGLPERWRMMIAEWMFEVVDHYSLDREASAIGMNYMDRYMSRLAAKGVLVSKRRFQLIAVSSLFLALKIHGFRSDQQQKHTSPSIETFQQLSLSVFTAAQIREMEQKLLLALGWLLNPPTTIAFVGALLCLLPSTTDGHHTMTAAEGAENHPFVYEMARYLAEVATCVSSFTFEYRPSEIAFASILDAIDASREDNETTSLITDASLSAFLRNVASTMSLTPDNAKMKEIRLLLMTSCPRMSNDEQARGVGVAVGVEHDAAPRASPRLKYGHHLVTPDPDDDVTTSLSDDSDPERRRAYHSELRSAFVVVAKKNKKRGTKRRLPQAGGDGVHN